MERVSLSLPPDECVCVSVHEQLCVSVCCCGVFGWDGSSCVSLFVAVGFGGGIGHMYIVHCVCLCSACHPKKGWSARSCSTFYVYNYRVHVEENIALN